MVAKINHEADIFRAAAYEAACPWSSHVPAIK
jgi:hypothetical protein